MLIQAAVLRGADQPYELEELQLGEPGPGEVLVEVAGTGVCHTDSMLRLPMFSGVLPVVPGHEGSGVVSAVGPGVTTVGVGDHVVMSFDSCGDCVPCHSAHPAHCDGFAAHNLHGRRPDGSTPVVDQAGKELSARWFGQSSFATHAIATARNLVRVDPLLPLDLLGPLGCGMLTGAGTVLNVTKPSPGQSLAVFGAGSVGLSSVMVAKLVGADPIIAVDLYESRLELAEELGATHVIHGDDPNLADMVRRAAGGGLDVAVETTGLPTMLTTVIDLLTTYGVLAIVGTPSGDVPFAPLDIAVGRTVVGVLEGDAVPQALIPTLLKLWRRGLFPFERLVTTFPLSEINQACKAAASGDVVKPVLLMGPR